MVNFVEDTSGRTDEEEEESEEESSDEEHQKKTTAPRKPNMDFKRKTTARGTKIILPHEELTKTKKRRRKCYNTFLSKICPDKVVKWQICYILVLILYCLCFLIFIVWIAHGPIPTEKWDYCEGLEFEFPQNGETHLKALSNATNFNRSKMTLSAIPTAPESCNFTCSNDQNRMSFPVRMTLEAAHLPNEAKHGGYAVQTGYPMLLASSDFETWWVAGDRNSSDPFAFEAFSYTSHRYEYTTDTCNSYPTDIDAAMPPFKKYVSKASYLVACVVFTNDKLEWHQMNEFLNSSELGLRCDSLGGVGGTPCSGMESRDMIITARDDTVLFSETNGNQVETPVKYINASFQGNTTLRVCDSANTDSCTSLLRPYAEWECHSCIANRSKLGLIAYQSFPRLGVRIDLDTDVLLNVTPHVYILQTGLVEPCALGSDFCELPVNSTDEPEEVLWVKMYESVITDQTSLDWPIKFTEDMELEVVESSDEEKVSLISNNMMSHVEMNEVNLEVSDCMGDMGKFFLVACVVNSTTYDDDGNLFEFVHGQPIRGPPFNDRCLAVTGVCGYACSNRYTTTDSSELGVNCSADGTIPFDALISELVAPTNINGNWLFQGFCITLISGLVVKLLTYVPGVFTPYKHFPYYKKEMTRPHHFVYITICIPSGGESKSCCLRNMVGATSCMPEGCECKYHVVFADEGHRPPLQKMYEKFCDVVAELCYLDMDHVATGNLKLKDDDPVREFFESWTEQTRGLKLKELSGAEVRADLLKRAGGMASLNHIINLHIEPKQNERDDPEKIKVANEKKEYLTALKKKIEDLTEEIRVNNRVKNNQEQFDSYYDWPPGEIPVFRGGCTVTSDDRLLERKLRVHYLARAKPPEDPRALAVQGVARGMACYTVENDTDVRKWLERRSSYFVYGMGSGSGDLNKRKDTVRKSFLGEKKVYLVPIRTSRGKAGGMNFVENYLHWYYAKMLRSGAAQTTKSEYRLFSICDARHQYQADFMHATLPRFFKPMSSLELDTKIAFTQTPQFFEEMKDVRDYLDNNNALFFRLNCMIRDCSGGVSSCGTNGTWLLLQRDWTTLWELPDGEVLPEGPYKEDVLMEVRNFHESCKVEDTASSLQQAKMGRRSQFVNRRLSYAMAKAPVDYLAAVQRWAEGGMVLSLQTFCHCHKRAYMLVIPLVIYCLVLYSLIHILIHAPVDEPWLVSLGFMDRTGFDNLVEELSPEILEICIFTCFTTIRLKSMIKAYVMIVLQTAVFLACLLTGWFCFGMTTVVAKIYYRFKEVPVDPGPAWPNSGRWWVRLFISLDNLTYIYWCWTCFFWVIFNNTCIYNEGSPYYFEPYVMLMFSVVLQVLTYMIVITATARYSTIQWKQSNEVAVIGLLNIWRSTQLFYMGAPMQVFSLMSGSIDYTKWRQFKVDISFWLGGDRGVIAKNIVRCWTLFLILAAIFAWFYFFLGSSRGTNAGSGLIINTIVGLDILQPCSYLWFGQADEDWAKFVKQHKDDKAFKKGGLCYNMKHGVWWRKTGYNLILNDCVTSGFKWIGPMQQIGLPILMIFMPNLGLTAAFLLLMSH